MATAVKPNVNLRFARTGDFETLKQFVAGSLKLVGSWSYPGGKKKLFSSQNASISCQKNKNLLCVTGVNTSVILGELFKHTCEYASNVV